MSEPWNEQAFELDGGMSPAWQKRMQWPKASMTRNECQQHEQGLLLHRDYSLFRPAVDGAYTFVGEFQHARSRQDAPNGWPRSVTHNAANCGALLVKPLSRDPTAATEQALHQPGEHRSFRWQVFRGSETQHFGLGMGDKPGPMPRPMEADAAWQEDLLEAVHALLVEDSLSEESLLDEI